MTEYWCPRRAETGSRMYGPDSLHRGGTCSCCGSMHPDDFMDIARTGSAEIGPTGKSYKAYVDKQGRFSKFYFQHLSEEQMREFVDLYNARPHRQYNDASLTPTDNNNEPGMKIGYPGHFYQPPYFMTRG